MSCLLLLWFMVVVVVLELFEVFDVRGGHLSKTFFNERFYWYKIRNTYVKQQQQ